MDDREKAIQLNAALKTLVIGLTETANEVKIRAYGRYIETVLADLMPLCKGKP